MTDDEGHDGWAVRDPAGGLSARTFRGNWMDSVMVHLRDYFRRPYAHRWTEFAERGWDVVPVNVIGITRALVETVDTSSEVVVDLMLEEVGG